MTATSSAHMGFLPDTHSCGLRECRERFFPPPRVSDPDMHHGTRVTHVPWRMPGSLTSGFLWSRWRGKRSWYSRRIHNPQFCVSGKRPVVQSGLVIRRLNVTWYFTSNQYDGCGMHIRLSTYNHGITEEGNCNYSLTNMAADESNGPVKGLIEYVIFTEIAWFLNYKLTVTLPNLGSQCS